MKRNGNVNGIQIPSQRQSHIVVVVVVLQCHPLVGSIPGDLYRRRTLLQNERMASTTSVPKRFLIPNSGAEGTNRLDQSLDDFAQPFGLLYPAEVLG